MTTYEPRNWRTEEGSDQLWEVIKEILNKTYKRHMVICCAGANGQLGREEEAEDEEEEEEGGRLTRAMTNKT